MINCQNVIQIFYYFIISLFQSFEKTLYPITKSQDYPSCLSALQEMLSKYLRRSTNGRQKTFIAHDDFDFLY